MEQKIEDIQSVAGEHSAAESDGRNNIQPVSVSQQNENSLNQDTPRNVNQTSPHPVLGNAGELITITQDSPRNNLAGVLDTSQNAPETTSGKAGKSGKAGTSYAIFKEESDRSEKNCSLSSGLNNIFTCSSRPTHLKNLTPNEDLASSGKHNIGEGETKGVIGGGGAVSGCVDENELLGHGDCSTSSEEFAITRAPKVIDIPNNVTLERCDEFFKDEIGESDASSLAAALNTTGVTLQWFHAEEDSGAFDEDDNSENDVSRFFVKHDVSDRHTVTPQTEDNDTHDEETPRDETLSGGAYMPRGISLDGCETCPQDAVVATSTVANETRDENTHKLSADDTTSRVPRSGEVICKVVNSETPAIDCNELDQEIVMKENDIKLTAPSANTDMPNEKPEQVVGNGFSSKVGKNIVPKFKELDASTQSADSYKPSPETSPDAPYKTFSSGGRKYGGVSSIINKYNTLLDSVVSPSDKDKYRPKSSKLGNSRADTSSCGNCAKEKSEEASRVSTREDTTRDGVKTSSTKTTSAQESNQKGDNVFIESRTDNYPDCIHTTRSINTCEDEENKTSTTEDETSASALCDRNINCGDIALTMPGHREIESKDSTPENTSVRNAETFKPVVEDAQVNQHTDNLNTVAALEEVCERNIVESPSESNSIWFGSTVDSSEEPFAIDTNESIDADDEFSSLDGFKSPTSPISTDENETSYTMRVMCCDELEGHIVETKSGMPEDSYTKDKSKERHGGCFRGNENVCGEPNLSLISRILNICQINNGGISLPNGSLKENDMRGFCEKSSQGTSHADKQTVETNMPYDNSHKQLNVEDKEFRYLDAESGDLNEQSEASWEHLVSCCNSGNQSCSETQDCNEDTKSIDSGSIYDDVASGSHIEYLSGRNTSDGQNLKYVSSYCSENDSCSNFYSEEGDHKQSDNQDGYLSALDLGEDPDIFRSTEHLDHLYSARSNVSGQDGNQNDDKISGNDWHVEYTSGSPFTLEDTSCIDCMLEDIANATGCDITDFADTTDTTVLHLTEKECEDATTVFDTNEYGKQVDLVNQKDITLFAKVNSVGYLEQESPIDYGKQADLVNREDITSHTEVNSIGYQDQESAMDYGIHCLVNSEDTTSHMEGNLIAHLGQESTIDYGKQVDLVNTEDITSYIEANSIGCQGQESPIDYGKQADEVNREDTTSDIEVNTIGYREQVSPIDFGKQLHQVNSEDVLSHTEENSIECQGHASDIDYGKQADQVNREDTTSHTEENSIGYIGQENTTGTDYGKQVDLVKRENITSPTQVNSIRYLGEENNIDYGKQVELVDPEDTTSPTEVNSDGYLGQKSTIETKSLVPSAEDTAETTSEKETFTDDESDCFPKEGNCTDYKEGARNVINMVEQVATHEDNSGKEDDLHDETTAADETSNQEIADVIKTKVTIHNDTSHYVDSNVSLNLDTIYQSDNSSGGECQFSEDTSVENASGSGSMKEDLVDVSSEQLSMHEAAEEGTTTEYGSEALASDGEDDEETKYACCEEFQVLWKRMKKLKKAMESLNEQVAFEKCYLEQEVDRYNKHMLILPPSSELSLFERKLAEVQRERWLEQHPGKITQEEYWRRLKEADQMCGQEIEQMNFAEEKLRHLTRITDVWMRTNVVLPYYDPPTLDLGACMTSADESPEATQKKVEELATEVVDMIGTSDAYMTSWLINEADRVKANNNSYPMTGNSTSNRQNFNDLSVDQMLLPPHLLEKLEMLRDVVKSNSLTAEIAQHKNRSDDQKAFLLKVPKSLNLALNRSCELENQISVTEKTESNYPEYSVTPDGT